jgi:hypothetical protein
MSASMRLYVVPEGDLRAFEVAPRTLQIWLRHPHSQPELSLDESWQDLDAILAAEPVAESRSFLTPTGADRTYPTAADHGAHGLSLASTRQLLEAIDQVSRPQVEAYVRQSRAEQLAQALEITQEEVSEVTDGLLLQLTRLRTSCSHAISKYYGLLMALWAKP